MESPNEGKTRGDATRSNEGLALVPFEPLQPTMDGENVVPHEIPQPLEVSPRANPDADREYSCKYCDKKFTNKQALGGHQNAHKVERALEKSAREMHENRFGYGGGSPYLGLGSTPYVGSYNRFYDFMNRSNVNRPSYPSQQPPPMQHGIQFGYNPQPGLSIGGEGNYVPRLFPGFNNMFPGYVGAQPLIPPQFSEQPSYMQHHGLMNRRFSNVGEGSSSARPNVSQGMLTNFMGMRPRASGNRGGGINDQRNDPRDQEQVGDSDLDLSLKL